MSDQEILARIGGQLEHFNGQHDWQHRAYPWRHLTVDGRWTYRSDPLEIDCLFALYGVPRARARQLLTTSAA